MDLTPELWALILLGAPVGIVAVFAIVRGYHLRVHMWRPGEPDRRDPDRREHDHPNRRHDDTERPEHGND